MLYMFGLWCLTPLSTIFQLCRGSAECETILTDTMPGNKQATHASIDSTRTANISISYVKSTLCFVLTHILYPICFRVVAIIICITYFINNNVRIRWFYVTTVRYKSWLDLTITWQGRLVTLDRSIVEII